MLPLARRLARTALPRLEEDDELGPSSSGAEAAVVRVAVASSTSGRLRTGSRRALEGGCLREPSGAARRGFAACSGFVNCCWWAWVRLRAHEPSRMRSSFCRLCRCERGPAPPAPPPRAGGRPPLGARAVRAAAKAGRAVHLREEEGPLPGTADQLLPGISSFPPRSAACSATCAARRHSARGYRPCRACAVAGPAPARGELAQLGLLLQAGQAARHAPDRRPTASVRPVLGGAGGSRAAAPAGARMPPPPPPARTRR